MNLSMRQLRALVQIARTRSFTRAAEGLFITQAGLSAAVRDLEEELGFRLFDRTTRSVSLTRAGVEFLPVAQRTLAELEAAAASIGQVEKAATMTLKVAATQLVAATILPEVCAALRKQKPGMQIVVMDVERPDVVKMVESGEADVGFGLFFKATSGLDRTPLIKLDLVSVAVRAAGGGKGTSAPTPWSALCDVPLLGLFPDSPVQSMVDGYLGKAGRTRPMGGHYRNFHTLIAMAEAGFGTTVVPSYILPLARRHKLQVSPMSGPAATLDFYQINKSGKLRAPAEAALVALLVKVMKRSCVLGRNRAVA